MKISNKALFFLSMILLFPAYASAGVSVYAEGAYTDENLVVYIYADISDDPLLSYGVKLVYPPADFGSPVVVKNTTAWYFGDPDNPYPAPNAEPDVSTAGEVIIVGGKLDSTDPLEGVSGDRVFLAKVTFTRLTNNAPGAELYLGKGTPYANFVQVDGTNLDTTLAGQDKSEPIGQVTIFKLGDANGDGYITSSDMFTVRGTILTGLYKCYMDCNQDGYITSSDMFCIKGKI
ncbi:dockerin type I domain-containing protein [uncultured Desulfobacter sp.]|uniref:dockerin type I domain-containing protein n=1 Tax=uncultured Desulfobacter sp. TaxID=240139 RepID=UPI002AAC0892|nr:dockerin type I domain-containing protein [uncultured Desulfobacter sp.]